MPEGPELKVICDNLQFLVDKHIVDLSILSGRYSKPGKTPDNLMDFNQKLPLKITQINVKGKLLYFVFENDWVILNTMGMSGKWTNHFQKHCHIELTYLNQEEDLDSDSDSNIEKIWFCDQRCFGTIKILTEISLLEKKLNMIGPDLLNGNVTEKEFLQIMEKHKSKNITKVLMNQSIISGCGNYIKSEALYRSKISPLRLISEIEPDKLTKLLQSLKQVITESYLSQGASIMNYTDVNDQTGGFTFQFRVYGRKEDPFGNKIQKIKTPDGRTSHWVPTLQE